MVSRHQIKKAVKVLELACSENFKDVKNELQFALTATKNYLKRSDKEYSMLSRDAGSATTSVYNFDDDFFNKWNNEHPLEVKRFIRNWISKQSDWKYPMVFLQPTHLRYCHMGIKSSLVYILSQKYSKDEIEQEIKKSLEKNAEPKQFRFKTLEHHGDIPDMQVPHEQIGNIITLDYFPYLSIQQIDSFMFSFNRLLRPGGNAFIHFADADGEKEWQAVTEKKITYMTQEIFSRICDKFSFKVEYYTIADFYTFAYIIKPGKLKSNKKGPTKMEKIV